MNIRVIVNPSAASGSARHKIPQLQRLLERRRSNVSVVETLGPGHGIELAREAIASTVDVLAVMGGDGTFNEVAQAYLNADGQPVYGPALALIPAGTGGDLRRSLRLTNDLEAAVERMLGTGRQQLDLGRVRAEVGSAHVFRAFLNVASIGVSATVSRLANAGPKWMGGKLTFYTAALRATFTYNNVPVSVRVDGQELYEGPAYLVAFANGRYFGGGMLIAPEAQPDDGLLDVVVLGDYSKARAVGLSRAIYAGTHLTDPQTHSARGKCVEVQPLLDSTQRFNHLLETDGEVPEVHLPLQADILRGALQLCVREQRFEMRGV